MQIARHWNREIIHYLFSIINQLIMSSACSIQFLFRDIAEWLHPSDFYQLLLQLSHEAKEDDLITVPYYEITPVIQPGDADQVHRVLQTCRYWGLERKDWPDELCHVLWGKGTWKEMEEIVHQLYPTMYIGNNLEKIMIDGNLRALQYQHKHGCLWTAWTCSEAALHGQLECLQYLHEHGCPWTEWTCNNAARNGQLECLKYAHEHGCHWTQYTCNGAARNGQLECLQYAHEHGCPWDERTCSSAAQQGQLECLQYAHQHGCPINWKECIRIARQYNITNLLHYLLEHQLYSKCVIS